MCLTLNTGSGNQPSIGEPVQEDFAQDDKVCSAWPSVLYTKAVSIKTVPLSQASLASAAPFIR